MGDVGTLDPDAASAPDGDEANDVTIATDSAEPDGVAGPDSVAVDPLALAELMPAFERLIRIGVYYPTGHPCCDLAATSVRSAIQLVVAKAPDLHIEAQRDALYVQGVDLDPESRGVAGFKRLLDEVGIVDLSIDPDITSEDLHTFVTRLLELRQEARSARSFTQLSIEGMPPSVRIRDREFLARRREQEYHADDVGTGPGLETLMAALQGHGLNRRQLALCQRFLEALPQHLENHRVGGGALPQTTWQDVESLLVKAVRQRSFERASNAAQQLAIRKNLGSLVALFEEIGDESANENWREAVDLLLSLNERPRTGVAGTAQGDAMMVADENEPEIEADLRAELGNLPVAVGAPVTLLPGDHLEELSVLMQVLQRELPLSSVARVQRRLREILHPPISDDELMAVAGGVRGILEQPASNHVDVQTSLVIEILRQVAPDAPPRLVCALTGALPEERRSALWPFAVNELLMAGSAVPPDQHQLLVEFVAADITPEELAALAPRIDRLEALRDRRANRTAARRLPSILFPHFGALFEASGKQVLGEWLLESLRQSPPCRTSRAVVPLLQKVRPAHREFLVAALRQSEDDETRSALHAGAGLILAGELPELPRDQRQEDWVIAAVKLAEHARCARSRTDPRADPSRATLVHPAGLAQRPAPARHRAPGGAQGEGLMSRIAIAGTPQRSKLDEMVILLGRGIAQRRLYFADHPRVVGFGNQFVNLLEAFLADRSLGSFFLGVVEGKLVFEGRSLHGPSVMGGPLIKFIDLLHGGGLTFRGSVTAQEVRELISLAAELKDPTEDLGESRRLLLSRGIEGIELAATYTDPLLLDSEEDRRVWEGRDAGDRDLPSPVLIYQALFDVVTDAHANATLGRSSTSTTRALAWRVPACTAPRPASPTSCSSCTTPTTTATPWATRCAWRRSAVYAGRQAGPGQANEACWRWARRRCCTTWARARSPTRSSSSPGKLDAEEFAVMQSAPAAGRGDPAGAPLGDAAGRGRRPGAITCATTAAAIRRAGGLGARAAVTGAAAGVRRVRGARPRSGPTRRPEPAAGLRDHVRTRRAFDAELLPRFVHILGLYPPGNQVRLNDGRFGTVVAPGGDPSLPTVRITHDTAGIYLPASDQEDVDLAAINETDLRIQGQVSEVDSVLI